MQITQLPRRPRLEEVLRVSVTPDDKRKAFETAARRGVTVSELIRQAMVVAIGNEQRVA
jgi:hypothetical protein